MGDSLRIGIFGGTFDPVHNVHLRIARDAREKANLDRVLFVVSSVPPHKRGDVIASAEERFAMVAAAVAGENAFGASRLEIDRPGPSYTVDTLRQVADEYPGAALYLIMGCDSARDLPHWRDPQGILDRAHLLVVARPAWDCTLDKLLDGHHTMLDFEVSDLSSTEVRDMLVRGDDVSEVIPPEVMAHISSKGLYGCR